MGPRRPDAAAATRAPVATDFGQSRGPQAIFLHNAREAVKVLDQPAPNAVLGSATLDQIATALAVKVRQLNWPDVQAMKQALDQQPALAILECFDELKSVVEFLGTADRA